MVVESSIRFLSSRHCPELTGKNVIVTLPDDAKVSDLKQKLEESEGYPADRMSFVYGATVYDDDVTLKRINVTKESFAFISFPHGGPFPPPPDQMKYPNWLKSQHDLKKRWCFNS